MMSFKIDLEAIADHKGQVKVPPELTDAYIMQRTGWTWDELRRTPSHLIHQMLFIWHLEEIAEKSKYR